MDWILRQLKAFEDRLAVHEQGHFLTFTEFVDRVEAFRTLLLDLPQGPFAPGSVIGIAVDHQFDALAALLAVGQLKHVALPFAPQDAPPARALKLALCQARACIRSGEKGLFLEPFTADGENCGGPAVTELLQALPQRQHGGLILFSSGSTGEAKAMLHDLDALTRRFTTVAPRQDRTLQLLLIDHIGGLDAALRTLLSGSTLIVPELRSPDAVGAAIAQHRATILPASPTFLNLMLLAEVPGRFDCSSLEIIAYGAEAMPPSLLRRLSSAFPGADLQQKFGTSETGAIRIKSLDRESLFFHITDRDTEWKIIEGELWLKTPSRILGYLNAPAGGLEADGWYRSGDLVEPGPGGSLRIIGRSSEFINVGGQKVHPAEIEAHLTELPGVTACQVYAEPDPITGNRIACRLVGSVEHSVREWKRMIRAHCRGKLAAWKIPVSLQLEKVPEVNQPLKPRSVETGE